MFFNLSEKVTLDRHVDWEDMVNSSTISWSSPKYGIIFRRCYHMHSFYMIHTTSRVSTNVVEVKLKEICK